MREVAERKILLICLMLEGGIIFEQILNVGLCLIFGGMGRNVQRKPHPLSKTHIYTLKKGLSIAYLLQGKRWMKYSTCRMKSKAAR